MKSYFRISVLSLGLIASVFGPGCATRLNIPSELPQPPSVKFSTFDQVEISSLSIAPAFSESGANQKAARKIEEYLDTKMKYVFSTITKIESEDEKQRSGRRMRIDPVIKEIKWIGALLDFGQAPWPAVQRSS